jgi:exodeoxyribonuclease VII large subunit
MIPMIDLLALHPFGPLTLSVSEATAHIKELLDDDSTLADLWVRGEIADARTYASGHTYFTLRDGLSQLRCVLFRQKARRLEPLENGHQYLVRGAISVYPTSGVYQLYVADHRQLGTGELYLQFEELKARLAAEGLFAPERKRPLPRWPHRIGIATSANGAVLHDLRQVIGRRFPLAELVLAPCLVQGADAVRSVVASLRALEGAGVDVVVVARGGGSIEDLWAFNHEAVARAIAAASVPVVSAIGHETDFTIADFVADCRAPTPSAAAELMVPDTVALGGQIDDLQRRAERALKAQLWVAQNDLGAAEQRLRRATAAHLAHATSRLAAVEGRLHSLSPLHVLSRGFAVVRQVSGGAVVRQVTQVAPGDGLEVLLADGTFRATVQEMQDRAS